MPDNSPIWADFKVIVELQLSRSVFFTLDFWCLETAQQEEHFKIRAEIANFSPRLFACADITNQTPFFSAESPSSTGCYKQSLPIRGVRTIFSQLALMLCSVWKCKHLKKSKNLLSLTDNWMLKQLKTWKVALLLTLRERTQGLWHAGGRQQNPWVPWR